MSRCIEARLKLGVLLWVRAMAESGADAEAFRLKSNQWSSSTLVKGMSSTAQQPFGLLAFGEQDKDLEEQLTEAWQ